ncbi:hypothetical protein NIE79_004219 [Micromonospora sp. NIE79]|uniref:Uncharacterized protein n=1 Tax=Micromonospora trifolii TaxID=2911208 RepID=A0ABS9N6Z7_9ACTN|nr:hypothetical protein [Micromonospora trifolii]MCG5445698.1 hypothetical protein [Micromonospora trifolii]
MTRRVERVLLALALGLLVAGWILRVNGHGSAHTIGRVLVLLGWICVIVAAFSRDRRGKRENDRLRAALLDGQTTTGADQRPDRPSSEDDRPSP